MFWIKFKRMKKALIMFIVSFGFFNQMLGSNIGFQNDLDPIVLPLWAEMQPTFSNGLGTEDEVEENRWWIRNVTVPLLYVYPAGEPNGKALLMCPGGGYAGVAISHEGKELAPILNEEGYTLAVLKYRVPNGNKNVPLEDVGRAMNILKEHAAEWGIDVNSIGIGGASAGGHLASTYATHPVNDAPRPAFQLLLYPVISMKEGITHEGSRKNLLGETPDQTAVNLYSNETQVTDSVPPTFIVVSEDDDVVPVENSLLYFSALKNHNIPTTLLVYPSGGHGWGTNVDFPYHNEWIAELRGWLKRL